MASLMINESTRHESVHRDCGLYDRRCRTLRGFRKCRRSKKNCMSPLYNKSRRAERNVKGDDLMSDRIMRCDRCKKQTVHVREGRRFQIRSKIEVIFRCGICGETVRLLEKKPKNPPRGLNWRRPY